MSITTFPSPNPSHRRADKLVHQTGFAAIMLGGAYLIWGVLQVQPIWLVLAVVVYVAAGLASNLASQRYHFSEDHARRQEFRRLDHAAIYPLITATFTPLLLVTATPWTYAATALTWALTLFAIWNKLTNPTVKSKWSTASYLGLGALGLTGLPAITAHAPGALVWIIAGAAFYVIGTAVYTRKALAYRFAIWHGFGFLGAVSMYGANVAALLT